MKDQTPVQPTEVEITNLQNLIVKHDRISAKLSKRARVHYDMAKDYKAQLNKLQKPIPQTDGNKKV